MRFFLGPGSRPGTTLFYLSSLLFLFVILKPRAFFNMSSRKSPLFPVCHPGRPSGARSIRDPEANPDLFASGSRILFDSLHSLTVPGRQEERYPAQRPGRQYFLLSQFFLCICHPHFLFCHLETSSLFNMSSRKLR